MADPKDLSRQDSGQAAQADQANADSGAPARASTAMPSGKPLDDAGGHGVASAAHSQVGTVADPQDQRDKS